MIVAGVDLGVRKAAIAVLDGTNLISVEAFESKATSRSAQLREVALWVSARLASLHPDAIYVEEPIAGRSTRISLQIAQTAGAVLSACGCLPLSNPGGTPCYLVPNTTWKKEVIGVGTAKDIKLKIRQWLDTMFPGYATPCDGDQDKYDATCIAIYAERQQRVAARLREVSDLRGATAFPDGEALA